MKRWSVILVLGVLLFGLWIFLSISRFLDAEKNLYDRFDAVVRYYEEISDLYIQPLTTVSDLSSGDREALLELESYAQELKKNPVRDVQYETLRVLQRKTVAFLSSPSLPESITLDARFQTWSKNATNFGNGSLLVRKYNDELSVYNNLRSSSVGSIVSFWSRWDHPEYLMMDGSLEKTPQVSF
jgi:hypothetical protein